MASIFRSAAPPYVPPASRRMSGSSELLLTGSTSDSPHSYSNDATTQRSSYPTKGTYSNLIRTLSSSGAWGSEPTLLAGGQLMYPPHGGNCQPPTCPQHLNSRIPLAARAISHEPFPAFSCGQLPTVNCQLVRHIRTSFESSRAPWALAPLLL